ncbi:MAG: aminotransferase class I/II-fold pyridoxal phosphate-dependent enzyme [Spirochaetales bacterium]|nr:aminotransferase class I/II-fold pyridoxal phosphate-dependent enzyme [Spirochaetales bacterium]
MHKLAVELNKSLEKTIAFVLLSDLGRSLYFPKGVVAQSADAAQSASLYNASVGMATLKKRPLYLNSLKAYIPELSVEEISAYAPTAGIQELRTVWKDIMAQKNPALKSRSTSLPIVTSGISHAVSMAADLFAENGDAVLLPEPFWDNYKLIFETRRKVRIINYPLFEGDKLNISALQEKLKTAKTRKLLLVLNFPHNPTGYTPTQAEAQELAEILLHSANSGKQLAVIIDDAYFGLFYEHTSFKQSLFSLLGALHENILAIKVDGATKEDLSWGLRIGFITFAAKSLEMAHYTALEKKVMGALRSSISSCSRLSQSLLCKALQNPRYRDEKAKVFSLLKERYMAVKKIVQSNPCACLTALPFNSGYFLSFKCHDIDAEQLRVYLLAEMGIGTVAISSRLLRVAYSSLDIENIPGFFEKL